MNEIVYTQRTKKIKIKCADNNSDALSTPAIVSKIMSDAFDQITEEVYVLMVDGKNRCVDRMMIAKGERNQVLVTPSGVYGPAIRNNCTSIIICHNHPSGDPAPSEDDMVFTRRMQKAGDILGVKLLDHVICCSGEKYFSFRSEGLL